MMTLQKARQQDPSVNKAWRKGASKESIILMLVEEKKALYARIKELYDIAPFKVIDGEGQEYVWHCPDELVPLREG